MADFSIDTTFLDVRQTRNSRTFVFLFFIRILFLFFGLLRRQSQDLQLVGRQALAVGVLWRHHDDVIGERLKVERGKCSLVAGNLHKNEWLFLLGGAEKLYRHIPRNFGVFPRRKSHGIFLYSLSGPHFLCLHIYLMAFTKNILKNLSPHFFYF